MVHKNEYELIYVIPGEKVDAVNDTREAVKKLIEKHGGEVKKESEPQKRKLAYVIKGTRNGVYVIVRLILDQSENLKTLYNDIKLMPSVLRHMIVKAQELPKEKKRPQTELDKLISEDQEEKKLLDEIHDKKEQEEKGPEKTEVETKEESPAPAKEKKETSKEDSAKEKATEKTEEKEEKEKETEKKERTAKKKDKKEKMKFEDLDKKLDDILKDDLI